MLPISCLITLVETRYDFFFSFLDVLKFFNFLHLPLIHLTNSFPFVYFLMHSSSHHNYHEHHHFGTIVVVRCSTRDFFLGFYENVINEAVPGFSCLQCICIFTFICLHLHHSFIIASQSKHSRVEV